MTQLVLRSSALPISPDTTVASVAGEIDISTVPELHEFLLRIPCRNTIVEMSGVTLLGAAGLAELLELRERLDHAGACVVLARAPACVLRILAVTGLGLVLVTAPTLSAGVKALTAGHSGRY